ncbi:MAG: glycosyltransferase [Gammaproteobacteria bacterium]
MVRDLIVFGEDWGALPSSTQHLISHLALSRKIIWVNSIGLRRPSLSKHDLKRVWDKLTTFKLRHNSTNKNINNNFYIVNPKTIPVPRTRIGRWIAAKLITSQIKPIIKMANINAPILWISLPTAVDIIGKLGESSTVYYCGDDFSGLAGVDHNIVVKREQELVEKSDLILAASEKLTEQFPPSRTRLLTHGVDFELFSTPVPRSSDLPDDGRPIAGFYGSISDWFNIKLLLSTIRKLPNWHFVLIGNPTVDVSSLRNFKNVTFLGERPHDELPSFSQHWTASLLPFKDNAQIRACNPLKLREYLAAGKPIISTSFPAVQKYKDIVQIADTSDEMVEALNASKHVPSIPDFQKALRSTVSQHSWAYKAQQTSQWLEAI